MTQIFKAACIQNCATSDVEHNMARCLELVSKAARAGANFIALPEYFSGLHTEGSKIIPVAFSQAEHPVIPAFGDAARGHGVSILLGSLGIKSPDGRIFNRSILLDANGEISARYDKIHMFDVNLGEGKVVQESATIAPGNEAVIATLNAGEAASGLGLSICYDLRFGALYRALAQGGASLLAIPAAFMKITGQAHWHVLNRARAIENGCYVIAPCQTGTLDGGAECYGHSLIIDPWGRVLADGGEEEGFVVADIDLDLVAQTRQRVPSLSHDRAFDVDARAQAAE